MALPSSHHAPDRLQPSSDWGTVAAAGGAREQSAAARLAAVEEVVHAMRSRLAAQFLLREMASLVYLSPCYFNRVFHEETGMPPRRFHMVLRMAAAKRMLLRSDMAVTDVCIELGYQSIGTFTTHFRKLVGVTPSGLRRLARTPAPTLAHLVAGLAVNQGAEPFGYAAPGHICGVVSGARPNGDAVVIVGLFADACPQGLPAACAVLDRAERGFSLELPQRGASYVAAAALPRRDDPVECLLPDESSVRIGAVPIPRRSGSRGPVVTQVRLRPLRSVDPPILLALPLLLALRPSSSS